MNFPLPFPCYLSNESRGEKARERERARERSLSIERGNGVVNNASPGRAKIKRLKIRICWRVRLGRMFRIAAGASNLAHPFQTSRTSLPLLGCRPYLGRSTLYKRIEPPSLSPPYSLSNLYYATPWNSTRISLDFCKLCLIIILRRASSK